MNLNKVFLIGRLTQDPDVKTTPSGQIVCTFGLATNRVWTDKQTGQKMEKTDFHNIVLWGKLAETASQYLMKGNLLLVEGRLQTRNWEDANGIKKYKTEIVAENIQLGPKQGNYSNNQETKFTQKTEEVEEIPIIEDEFSEPQKKEANNEFEKDEEEIDIKDIPF